MTSLAYISHDEERVEPASPAGLCALCDQPVETYDIGIATQRHMGQDYAYLCHASCLSDYDEEEE